MTNILFSCFEKQNFANYLNGSEFIELGCRNDLLLQRLQLSLKLFTINSRTFNR